MASKGPKKILILGSTGPTGLLTVRTALEHDLNVTVYARNPSKIPTDLAESPKLKVRSFLSI